MYNNALISWDHQEKDKADNYVLEYRKITRDEEILSWNEVEVLGTSKVISDLENNCSYAFRVRAYKGSVCSPNSRELILHTPPASGIRNTPQNSLKSGLSDSTVVGCLPCTANWCSVSWWCSED